MALFIFFFLGNIFLKLVFKKNIMALTDQINKAIEHLKSEYSALQIGRASAQLVENIEVESYGSMMGLKGVANIGCPDAKTIRIEPWDKNLVGAIEKALQDARIGINPQNMGEYILLPIPPMTEDRRKDLVKIVHSAAETAKISIRNSRQDEIKSIKQQKDDKEISEDQQKDLESDVQDAVNKGNKDVEEIMKKKEQDIMTI